MKDKCANHALAAERKKPRPLKSVNHPTKYHRMIISYLKLNTGEIMRAISLFSGAGGLDIGFQQAGADIV